MKKEMEKEKNIMIMVEYNLKENIYMGKNGLVKDIMKKEKMILQLKKEREKEKNIII